MQPADVRFDPWVWIPLSRRRGRVLPTVLVAAVAAASGYMLGRHSDGAGVASPQRTVAARPVTQPVAVNSKAKTKEPEEKPDLALKSDSETVKRTPSLTQTMPEPPPVVLLNPGTATPKGDVRNPATTRESGAASTRGSGDETHRADAGDRKRRDERAVDSPNSMRDYRDLREYMLNR
jgi:hypothetical protein